jgi:Asp-tRNA(Asn)/Glu-tRNA(Gln) amidotransferase A subunit family amidase
MRKKSLNRRNFLATCTRWGLAATAFPATLWVMAQENKGQVTKEMIADAAALVGLDFDEKQREMMLRDLNNRRQSYQAIHDLHLANDVYPAVAFNPVLLGMKFDEPKLPARLGPAPKVAAPKNVEDVAFYSVRQLGELIRARKISSLALTEMYLERLKRYDPLLKFVITLTEERALAQAKEADRDLARGKYRGPLHGLPWGAKDLLAAKGYRTTWGAGGFEDQKIEQDAAVVQRLDAAGAVLVAKLTLGALAMGDVWFGGTTKNPWKPDQGSSGSSAGPAAATAAGCVAFGVGSETLGSISSPSTRCGVTGLRPTFGRVPRTGAMALSWSMDKLGALCRSAEDCALVLAAICGPDGQDPSVHDIAFNWDATLDLRKLRVGYVKADFEREAPVQLAAERRAAWEASKKFDTDALDVLRKNLGLELLPVELPKLPIQAMRPILEAEAAAAFDELTRSGRDKLLTAQGPNDWPNTFREAHFMPAVEYINANRARMLLMQQAAEIFKKVDVFVSPTNGGQLLMTNLTGHPAVILPHGFRPDGTPVSLTFVGNLFGEAQMLAVAKAYQEATGFHLKHPELKLPPPEEKKA